MSAPTHHLFLVASTRTADQSGNTEHLARVAAAALPAQAQQTWMPLAPMALPPFVDQRHTVGTYERPVGDLARVLDATMACTDLVWVAPVYWYSFPSPLKTMLDHWSAWLRVPGLDFKAAMSRKRLHLVTTSGSEAKAQPMIASTRLTAEFLGMPPPRVLWGQGGAPGAAQADAASVERARRFFVDG